ncbi:MAG: hypothetical protein WBI33_03490, partial [Bacteroidales bacterium]
MTEQTEMRWFITLFIIGVASGLFFCLYEKKCLWAKIVLMHVPPLFFCLYEREWSEPDGLSSCK